MERVLGNKVNFSNLVIYSLSILTSCQFSIELNPEISRGVLQNRGVWGKRFLFSPPASPSIFFFFLLRSNFRAVTRLETLATRATVGPAWQNLAGIYLIHGQKKNGGNKYAWNPATSQCETLRKNIKKCKIQESFTAEFTRLEVKNWTNGALT